MASQMEVAEIDNADLNICHSDNIRVGGGGGL
jgi:hypothetical protein